jgi:hypothetical protein
VHFGFHRGCHFSRAGVFHCGPHVGSH